MSRIARFAAYAAAFERAYESNGWTELEEFFTEDCVYEIGLPALGMERCEGRDAILAWFPVVLDGFDRRFASRQLAALEGPTEEGDEVRLRGTATYRAEGVPDFVLELEEILRFEGDRIAHLEDRYSEPMRREAEAYVHEHGAKLGFDLARP